MMEREIKIIPESHVDHGLTPGQLAAALALVEPGEGVTVATVELPEGLGTAPCAIRGPIVGDEPITEDVAIRGVRGERAGASRLVLMPCRRSRLVTVVVGPHGDEPCVLYTAYAGPEAPREPWDPSLDAVSARESDAFWSEHALALRPAVPVCDRCGDTWAGDPAWPWAGDLDTSLGGCGPCGDLHSWGSGADVDLAPPLGSVLINVTPHTITVSRDGRPDLVIPPSGVVARVETTTERVGEVSGIAIVTSDRGEVVDLPPGIPGVSYVASAMVRVADERLDVLSPGALIRGLDGRPVGCDGLVANRPAAADCSARSVVCGSCLRCHYPVWSTELDGGRCMGDRVVEWQCACDFTRDLDVPRNHWRLEARR